jgi:glutamate 5-kinase
MKKNILLLTTTVLLIVVILVIKDKFTTSKTVTIPIPTKSIVNQNMTIYKSADMKFIIQIPDSIKYKKNLGY